MAEKRTLSNDKKQENCEQQNSDKFEDMYIENSDGELVVVERSVSKCNWCCKDKQILVGKKFCYQCGCQGKECPYCHRPMPRHCWTLSEHTCNSCFRKHRKQADKRKQLKNRRALTATAQSSCVHQSPITDAYTCKNKRKRYTPNRIQRSSHPNNQIGGGDSVSPTQNADPNSVDNARNMSDRENDIPLEADRIDRSTIHVNPNSIHEASTSQVDTNSSLNGFANVTTFHPIKNEDLRAALAEVEQNLIESLSSVRHKLNAIKYYITCTAEYEKLDIEGETTTIEMMFHTDALPLMNDELINEHLPANFHQLNKNAEEFEAEGSGWNLKRILNIKVHMGAYTPLVGSCYIPLPQELHKKKAVLNIQNDDDKCIAWCLLAHMFPKTNNQNPCKVSSYRQNEHDIDMTGVTFPTPLKDIARIESNNSLSINVFSYDGVNGVIPQRISRNIRNQEHHVNLLLLTEVDKRHYCLIRNFSRLMGQRTKKNGKQYYCYNCLHGYSRQDLHDQHFQRCIKHKAQRAVYPKQDEKLKFKNIANQLPAPFVIYADFECFTTKIATCGANPSLSNTNKTQQHDPSGFCCITVCNDDPSLSRNSVVYRGDNVVEEFYKQLFEEEEYIRQILDHPKPLVMSQDDECRFKNAFNCHICKKPLGEDRVRDHNHITGDFRGAAHNECNLAYKYKKMNADFNTFTIPIVFHNLRGYDSHILMKRLGEFKSRKLQCIPNNKERYISFTVGNLRFIDSYQFMGAPLDKLVNNLVQKGKHQFRYMMKEVPDQEQQNLLLRKGVYPYDYMDSPDKFAETHLPKQHAFYSLLIEEEISDADYTHAQAVWSTFKCRTLGDYHDLYMRSDVLLLADVFEFFRQMALTTYELDPAHYYTSPGLSWDSMLRYTKVELQLLHDPDMYLLVESGIRGGVSMITKKWASANNHYMKHYDANEPSNFIVYLDANNLYGWAMSQKMPVDSFEWVPEDQLQNINIDKLLESDEEGYILEVDLEYPQYLHDAHSDYPLAPQTKPVPREELSGYSQQLAERLNVKGQPQGKLMTTLDNRTHYVLHYVNLKLYLRLGMRLTKIHRAVKFRQSNWLEKYIALNTEMRKQAQSTFEKDFYKLMNNSVFGKTMENVRGHIEMELVHTEERFMKLTAKPTFHRFHIFNEDLSAVRMLKTTIKLNKPIYVGFSILDLSKTLMYEFHYDYIRHKYGGKAQLCFTDTDSLMYDINTPDVFADMFTAIDRFDTSAYPENHMLHSQVNKKVLGKMKDEMSGKIIEEFIGLRSKMYSIKSSDEEKKTAKGIKKSAIKRLRHAKYKDALFDGKVTHETMRTIRSINHELFTLEVNKVGLCSFDDKRYVLDDKFTTRAHGHYKNF